MNHTVCRGLSEAELEVWKIETDLLRLAVFDIDLFTNSVATRILKFSFRWGVVEFKGGVCHDQVFGTGTKAALFSNNPMSSRQSELQLGHDSTLSCLYNLSCLFTFRCYAVIIRSQIVKSKCNYLH